MGHDKLNARLSVRWRNSRAYVRYVSNARNQIRGRSPKQHKKENQETAGIPPHYLSYQLVGDSNLLRFATQVCGAGLGNEPFVYPQAVRHSGLCVSGQSVGQLLHRVQVAPELLGKRIILMIGTNSVRRRLRLLRIIERFKKLVSVILKNGVERLILCSILPIPKLAFHRRMWKRIIEFNNVVLKTAKRFKTESLDVFNHFAPKNNSGVSPSRRYIRSVFFQRRYRNGRTDLIHLNRKGLFELKRLLDSCGLVK